MAVPKVSILVPTYNYARYLPEAIESILEQDFQNFELLISDDCSTDNSAKVIATYAAKDNRIRFQIHSTNLGMVQNWNWCLSQSRGEYIKYLFGDDKLADRQALTKLTMLMETHPSVILAASARNIIDDNSKVVDVWNHLGSYELHQGIKIIAHCWGKNVSNLIGEPSAVMFRKRDATRGFDITYRQLVDLEMWFHLLEKGDFAYTTEALCCFRRHEQQQTKVNDNNKLSERETLRLFNDYSHRPYLRPLLHNQLYEIRKHLKKTRWADMDMIHRERDMSTLVGKFPYGAYWLRRKITQPFLNLLRSIKKRINQLKSSIKKSKTSFT